MRALLFCFCGFLLLGVVAAPAQEAVNLGEVVIKGDALKVITVTVTGSTPELNTLANVAFSVHGAFRRVASGGSLELKFAAAGPTAVQLQVVKAGQKLVEQTVSGDTQRQALFRAADQVVKAITRQPGFFNSRLTFISERTGFKEIYTSDLFGGDARQITQDRAQAMTPRWSPDGSKIVYTGFYKSGYPDIFLYDLRTSRRSTLVSFRGTNSGARFNASGSQVAMVLSGEGNPEIYVANAQGRGVTRLTRSASVEASPVFSPDGSRLVYTSDVAGGPQLYLMPVKGGAGQRLVTNLSRYCAEPDWSRGNPNKIAFTAAMGSGYQIGVLDLSGKTPPRVVTKEAFDAVEPTWLADGRHLVYTARAVNTRALYLLDTESGRSTRISPPGLGKTSQASVWLP